MNINYNNTINRYAQSIVLYYELKNNQLKSISYKF